MDNIVDLGLRRQIREAMARDRALQENPMYQAYLQGQLSTTLSALICMSDIFVISSFEDNGMTLTIDGEDKFFDNPQKLENFRISLSDCRADRAVAEINDPDRRLQAELDLFR